MTFKVQVNCEYLLITIFFSLFIYTADEYKKILKFTIFHKRIVFAFDNLGKTVVDLSISIQK